MINDLLQKLNAEKRTVNQLTRIVSHLLKTYCSDRIYIKKSVLGDLNGGIHVDASSRKDVLIITHYDSTKELEKVESENEEHKCKSCDEIHEDESEHPDFADAISAFIEALKKSSK